MKRSLYIGRFADIKVFVHWTFLILLAYIIFIGVSAGHNMSQIGWHLLFILTIFVCVILHEFGHALTGRRFGFRTKDIVLLPIGGLARFEKLPENPKQEFLIAIAGPAVNFLIAALIFIVVRPSIHFMLNLDISSINGSNFFTLLWMVNLMLGLFNLIPAFPMDGGRIFRAFLSMFQPRDKATRIAALIGQVLAIAFILAGVFYNPFLVLIGIFIIISGSSESTLVDTQVRLEGHTVSEIVIKDFATIEDTMTIKEAAQFVLTSSSTNFVVKQSGQIIGAINRDQIINALSTRDFDTPVAEVIDHTTGSIDSETPLKELLTSPLLKKNALVPVVKQGLIIGVINLENVLEFIAIKQATPYWKSLVHGPARD